MANEGGATRGLRRLGAGGLVLVMAAIVALLAIGISIWRSRVLDMPAAMAPPQPGDVNDMIGQLERKMQGNTTDADGWRMLGWSYFETGRYADAARAYGHATRIDPRNAQYWSALGEATVLANKSGVTPDAAAAFGHALAIDPRDPRARYFIGVQKDMAGNHAGAIDDWIALLKDTPAGAPWEADVRRLVTQVAATNKIDVAGRIPPAPPEAPAGVTPGLPAETAGHPPIGSADDVATAAIPGPTREQMESAAQLPPSAQDAMVQAMVDRLAARLKSNPRDADGWIRLMRARMVLNDAAGAQGALAIARSTFAGDAASLSRLSDAGRALGVPGA